MLQRWRVKNLNNSLTRNNHLIQLVFFNLNLIKFIGEMFSVQFLLLLFYYFCTVWQSTNSSILVLTIVCFTDATINHETVRICYMVFHIYSTYKISYCLSVRETATGVLITPLLCSWDMEEDLML